MYQSSETVIQIAFNLIGGASADKGDRKKIAIITDLLAAMICIVLSFFVETSFMAQIMITANALLALVYAFNSPTYKSLNTESVNSYYTVGGGIMLLSLISIALYLFAEKRDIIRKM